MKFMNSLKKALALILALAMLLLACSCSSKKNEDTEAPTDETEEETESQTETEPPLAKTDILLSGEKPFRIVFSDGYKTLATKIFDKLVALDKNFKTGKYPLVLDTATPADDTPEILIGTTNRSATEEAKKLITEEGSFYAIYSTEKAIALYAANEAGIEAGIKDLLTGFSKKGTQVIYNGAKGNYAKEYDNAIDAASLLEALANAARTKKLPVHNISVYSADGISNASINGGNPCQNCYSVTKVYCVTAIGMLYDEGKIKTTDTIGQIFADEIAAYGVDTAKWADITVHDVMKHKAGFTQGGFLDIDSQDATKWDSQDYLKLVLEAELDGKKGYKYTDGAYYLISRIVTKLSGQGLDEFLAERLFNKTNCREYAFACCPQGYPIGATGLYIRSEDVTKLGRIYLDGGKYNGQQIISKEWVDTVLERGYELNKSGEGYAKGGMRGQNLYINFEKNVSVAWHSYADNSLGETLHAYIAK